VGNAARAEDRGWGTGRRRGRVEEEEEEEEEILAVSPNSLHVLHL